MINNNVSISSVGAFLEVILQGRISNPMNDFEVQIPDGYEPVVAFVNLIDINEPASGCGTTIVNSPSAPITNVLDNSTDLWGQLKLSNRKFSFTSGRYYAGWGNYLILGYKV